MEFSLLEKLVGLQLVGCFDLFATQFSLLEKLVGLQRISQAKKVYFNLVYSKNWSVCNRRLNNLLHLQNLVYSKNWSVCNYQNIRTVIVTTWKKVYFIYDFTLVEVYLEVAHKSSKILVAS